MCVRPLFLPNPYYCSAPAGTEQRFQFEKKYPYWFLHDTTSLMIKVPCGTCSECLQARQNEFVQRCYMMSKFNYVLFGTLTYSNDSLPYIMVNDYKLKFADVRDFQNFIKRIRKYEVLPNFRYLAVTEYGEKSNRPHFHFLFFIPFEYEHGQINNFKGYEYADKLLDFITSERGWSRNYGTSKTPVYYPLSFFIRRFGKSTYDCQYVSNGCKQNVSYYVTKYVLKFSQYVSNLQSALKLNLSEEQYLRVWSVVRPKLLTSKGLGVYIKDGTHYSQIDSLIDFYIGEEIDFSLLNEKVPMLAIDNKNVPLCKYYQDRLMTMEQRIKLHNNRCEEGPFQDEYFNDDIKLNDFRTDLQTKETKELKFEKIKKQLNNSLF